MWLCWEEREPSATGVSSLRLWHWDLVISIVTLKLLHTRTWRTLATLQTASLSCQRTRLTLVGAFIID